MTEALETWPVDMIGKILPRHLSIIFEINDFFLKTIQDHYPDDLDLLSRISIIDENARPPDSHGLAGGCSQSQSERRV